MTPHAHTYISKAGVCKHTYSYSCRLRRSVGCRTPSWSGTEKKKVIHQVIVNPLAGLRWTCQLAAVAYRILFKKKSHSLSLPGSSPRARSRGCCRGGGPMHEANRDIVTLDLAHPGKREHGHGGEKRRKGGMTLCICRATDTNGSSGFFHSNVVCVPM